jgi:hypothetical protein
MAKLNGNKCEVTGVFWYVLKKREKEENLSVVAIDEFMTSRICNICYKDSLKKMNGVNDHSVLECHNCTTLWQRDINAAKNMLLISSLIWNGNDRPGVFSLKARIYNTYLIRIAVINAVLSTKIF